MSQLAFKRVGPAKPWNIKEPLTAAIVEARAPSTVNWLTGSPDTKDDHQAAVVYTGAGLPDFTTGMIYIVFFIQGDAAIYLATVDNAVDMDTLVGPTTTWGIDSWLDADEGHNWQQF